MDPGCRVSDEALDLSLTNFIRRKRERYGMSVPWLGNECVPVDSASIESWWSSRLQSTDRKAYPLQRFSEFDRSGLAGPTCAVRSASSVNQSVQKSACRHDYGR